MVQEFNKYWMQNQKSAYEMVKEIINEKGIKLKEENMEDGNKTVVELIADLQNQLDKANNRIEELAEENTKLICKNFLLKEDSLIANNRIEELAEENTKLICKNFLLKEDSLIANKRIDKFVKENNKLTRENMILDEDNTRVNKKYCEYNQAAQDAWNENNKIKNEIEKLKNENEYLEGIIDWVISENDELSKEITKWYNKYTKEKVKHDKATKKIDELKKHQKDELAWSDKRRHDNIDSLLYSYWGLKEYYQEAKCNKNEANDAKE